MNVIETVALIQFLITIGAITIGRVIYKLSPLVGLFSALLVCPVPIFVVGMSSAGFIYFSDLIGLLVLLVVLAKGRFDISTLSGGRVTYGMVVITLVIIPLVASIVTTMRDGNGDGRWILLGLFRGISYVFIFVAASKYAVDHPEKIKSVVCVQAITITSVCGIGILQFFLNLNLDLWNEYANYDFTEWIGGFGHGFMGLYRGAIGAWTAGMAAVIISVTNRQRFGALLAVLFIIFGLAANVLVGSRQGLVGTLIGLIISLILGVRNKKNKIRSHSAGIFFSVTLIVGAALLFGGNGISNQTGDVGEWLGNRFDLFSSGSETIDEAKNRDPRMPLILDRVANAPENYLIGLGYGRVISEAMGSGLDLIYVDSELLWTLQQTGFIGIISYVLMIAIILSRVAKGGRRGGGGDQLDKIVMGGSLVCVGIFLTYGHFFLLHVQSSQAPVAYWNWLMLGFCMATPSHFRVNLKVEDEK